MELVGLQVLIEQLLQGRLQIGSVEVRRQVHPCEPRSRECSYIEAKMLSYHVLGHPGQPAFDFGTVDRLRKNDNDRTPGLSLRSQITPNLPDLCLNQLAYPVDLSRIRRRARYREHQCRRIPEV